MVFSPLILGDDEYPKRSMGPRAVSWKVGLQVLILRRALGYVMACVEIRMPGLFTPFTYLVLPSTLATQLLLL